jgi:hypothetical protein
MNMATSQRMLHVFFLQPLFTILIASHYGSTEPSFYRSSNSSADAEWALSVPVEDFIYVSGIYDNI